MYMGLQLKNGKRPAFSLAELLVVISIIAMLTGLLLPILSRARNQSRSVVCLSNLRQMAVAASVYTQNCSGYYPIAYYQNDTAEGSTYYRWDFTAILRNDGTTVVPGLLWQGQTTVRIQQCPAFNGKSNDPYDPYTGYNYNTSYIGHGQNECIQMPARVDEVKRPGDCALFGDGQYIAGANKYMRAPKPNPADVLFSGREAGTQGYRHLGRTNVAWCDGSSRPVRKCYNQTGNKFLDRKIAPGTGFLSPDNSAYDLE
jgi:prepilin-type processing-associated H-X9-DG protein/prepilin-type N-terminal cleavage/methylation domain-containing protein